MQAFVLTTLFLFAPERPFLGSAFTVHQKRFSPIFVQKILMRQPPPTPPPNCQYGGMGSLWISIFLCKSAL
ncbi:MAG TPA: hypothetical protein PLJ16_02670 [Casimicrobium huifangae]|nr:hypothetical protein [Casimicrobium huifangae]